MGFQFLLFWTCSLGEPDGKLRFVSSHQEGGMDLEIGSPEEWKEAQETPQSSVFAKDELDTEDSGSNKTDPALLGLMVPV